MTRKTIDQAREWWSTSFFAKHKREEWVEDVYSLVENDGNPLWSAEHINSGFRVRVIYDLSDDGFDCDHSHDFSYDNYMSDEFGEDDGPGMLILHDSRAFDNDEVIPSERDMAEMVLVHQSRIRLKKEMAMLPYLSRFGGKYLYLFSKSDRAGSDLTQEEDTKEMRNVTATTTRAIKRMA